MSSEAPNERTTPPSIGALWALEATTDNVILLDREFQITYINQATARLNGIRQDSVLGRSIWDVWPGNVGTDIEKNYRKAMAEGVPVRFLHPYFEQGRFDLWLEIHAYPSPEGLAIFFHDLSDIKRQEDQLAEDRERLARAIAATDLGVWRVNLPFDGQPFYLSAQVRRHFGISMDEDVAMEQFAALLHPEDRESVAAAIAKAIEGHVPYDVVYRTIANDGKIRWVRASGNAFYRPDGTAYQFDGFTLDYTERVESERALRDANSRIEATLASADVGTWLLDVAKDQINGDANLGRLFGMDAEAARAGSAADYIARVHPDDQALVTEALGRSLAEGTRFDVECRVLANGRVRWLVARGMPETDTSGTVVRLPGVVVEITVLKATQEREKLALEAMRASEERFRQLVELSPATVWFAEPDGGLSYISRDFYDASGLTPETALPYGWAETVHPEDIQRVMIQWEDARLHESPYDTEFRIRLKTGEYLWISARALPVRNADGEVSGWLGINSDIQEKKEMEQTLLDRVAERTAELQRTIEEAEGFNYSISHDLRSPLRAIISTAQILLEEAGPELDGTHRKLLERQSHNARRLSDLIDELLRLSRFSRVAVNRESVNVTTLVQNLVGTLQTPCKIEIEEGLEAEADPQLLGTIFQNLVENACKFSPTGEAVQVGKRDGAFFVRDHGIGFEMTYAAKIFQPFERLVREDEFPGTGIGLANVKRLVERHGGTVWAESELGKGATFFFTLGS